MHMKPNHEVLICNLDWWKDNIDLASLQGQVQPQQPFPALPSPTVRPLPLPSSRVWLWTDSYFLAYLCEFTRD